MKRSCAVVRCGVALCGKEGTRDEKKNGKPKGREVGSLKEEIFKKKKIRGKGGADGSGNREVWETREKWRVGRVDEVKKKRRKNKIV